MPHLMFLFQLTWVQSRCPSFRLHWDRMIASLIQTRRLDFPLLSLVPVRLPRKKQQRKIVQQTVSSDTEYIISQLAIINICRNIYWSWAIHTNFFTIMIIWQSSLKVNPSVLNGSFLVEILRYWPTMARSYTGYYFCFRNPEMLWCKCHVINYLLT